jgi:MarR family 2-MHQ and catechol resistance regulon transcriptional repressor
MKPHAFLPVIRELARCYQAFDSYSSRHVRSLGLTSPQFDIIATLGNTAGMTFKELGEKTLITKGTLTGVVDRLEAKKLVRRLPSPTDGRCQIVQLTPKGEKVFAEAFPAHLAHVAQAFAGFDTAQLQQTQDLLQRLGSAFRREPAQPGPHPL